MRRSSLLRPTFRLKLLLALIGTIAPLLLVTLLVVRREANQQIDAIIESTRTRAGDLITRIERVRQQQLEQLGVRFAESNRVSAALQQALEGDTTFLIGQAEYELGYAGVPDALVAFTTLGGEPIAALVDRKALPDAAAAVPATAIERVLAGDTAVYGYHFLHRRLFSVHPIIAYLVDQPIGVVLLGFAIDQETAASLGDALRADVCFEAQGVCVASASSYTAGATKIATIARPLPGGEDTGSRIVLRVPLDDFIRPFTAIQRAIQLVGLAVLVLAIVIALFLSHGLAQPVRALVAATVRVARGEYDTHVEVRSRDELGTLANAFNEMTHGLMLKEKYRGVLDKVVSRDVADEMLKGEITLGGETREVTTLFADLRGFTAMSEGMEPQAVIGLLNEVMEHAEAAVVAEGGVVDKYVGDEIMAIFGAPIAHGDDALRAVRAAVRMQQQIGEINAGRIAEGKAPVAFGIGINTGVVVAGNMGSARRLNYTVLGGPVNLAARLCSESGSGQVLFSRPTLDQVKDHVHVTSLGTRAIKGFSQPIELFELIGLEEDAVPASTSSALRGRLGLVAALLLSSATAASAQRVFTAGPLQIDPSARIDLLAFAPGADPPGLIAETDPFVAGRASLFADLFIGSRIYGLVEARLDRGETPGNGDLDLRLEQAFARITPFHEAVSLQAGRFVSPFGGYPQRHHSSADPLIRPPLSYDHRTVVSALRVARSRTGFLTWKNEPLTFRPDGAPPVWAAPYQLGAMLVGATGKLSYRVAIMNGAPSAEPRVWNDWPDASDLLSYVAHAALQLTPGLRVGASFNSGPYLEPDAEANLPSGFTRADYAQRLVGLEATLTRGHIELRSEVIHDTWSVSLNASQPDNEDLTDLSYYLEARLKLGAGWFVSSRFGAMHFNDLRADNGIEESWDYDMRRLQIGAGYRFNQRLDVRGEFMLNDSSGPVDPRDNLFSIQASWAID